MLADIIRKLILTELERLKLGVIRFYVIDLLGRSTSKGLILGVLSQSTMGLSLKSPIHER